MVLKKKRQLLEALGMLGAAAVILILVATFSIHAGGTEATRQSETTVTSDTTNYSAIQMPAAAETEGTLVLVDGKTPWSFPENDDLTTLFDVMTHSYSVRSSDIQVDSDIVNSLNAMMDAFQKATSLSDLNVVAGYRSLDDQKQLKQASIAEDGKEHSDRYVAAAGNSEHHTGLAIDLQIYRDGVSETFTGEGKYAWLYEHCADYGFVLRYPEGKEDQTGIANESWHFRYVGAPHAQIMTERGLCLEEYLELLQEDYSWDSAHLQADNCEIYYCPGDTIHVAVGADYEVSGINQEGYVVTVWQN